MSTAQNHAIDSDKHSLRFKYRNMNSFMHMLTVIGSIRLEADLARVDVRAQEDVVISLYMLQVISYCRLS